MPKVEGEISANNSKFIKALNECESRVKRFKFGIQEVGKALAIGWVAGKVKAFVDELDALGKRADDLRITAAELKAFSHEAEHAGLATGEFDDAMKSFAEKMGAAASGTGTEAEQLKKLGVSITDLNGNYKSTGDLLMEVADAYKENAGGAESAKIATDLFGGSGLKMVRVLEQGSEALRAQVKDFDSYNNAVVDAAALNDSLADASSTLEKLAINVGGYIATAFNVLTYGVRGKSYMEESLTRIREKRERQDAQNEANRRKAEEKALTQAEEDLKVLDQAEAESLKEREKRNAEYQKAQAEAQKARLEMIDAERADAEKILFVKEALKVQEAELQNMQAGTTAYAKAELDILKNQKKLRELEAKEKERIAKAEEDAQRKREDALKKQKELSDKLLSLEQARNVVLNKAKERRQETLENAGERGSGNIVGRVVKGVKSYEEKAQTALAQGRYNDYFKYSDKATSQRQKAETKRESQMQNKIDSYEKLGNREGANRLRAEMTKEGFGKEPVKEDVEKLKEIEEHTKETKEALEKLLKGLEG